MSKVMLVCLVGPSASGKTTIGKLTGFPPLTCVTTRSARPGEIPGKDYDFLTVEEFHRMLDNGELWEDVVYNGNFYGIPGSNIMKVLESDIPHHTVVTIEGYHKLMEFMPKPEAMISIFVYTPLEQIINRMSARGDTEKAITDRINSYNAELETAKQCDYIIANPDGCLDIAIATVKAITLGA